MNTSSTKCPKAPIGLVKMSGGEIAVLDGCAEYRGRLVIGTVVRVTRGREHCRYFFTSEAVEGLGIWFVIETTSKGEHLRRAAAREIERADRLMHAFTDFEDVLA